MYKVTIVTADKCTRIMCHSLTGVLRELKCRYERVILSKFKLVDARDNLHTFEVEVHAK